jgi:hypothetical protein
MNLSLRYQKELVLLSTMVMSVTPERGAIVLAYPEIAFTSLQRRAARVAPPEGLKVSVVATNTANKLQVVPSDIVDFTPEGIQMQSGSYLLHYPADAQKVYVMIQKGERQIACRAEIVRAFLANGQRHFGCFFTGMKPEDQEFLYESVYEKMFPNVDKNLLVNGV